MSLKLLSRRKNLRKALSDNSLRNFSKVLVSLCRSYAHYPDVVRLEALISSQSYGLAIEHADYMSEQSYITPTDHFVANQFAALVRKYPWPKHESISFDPRMTAIKKFAASEAKCLETDARFEPDFNKGPYAELLAKARNFIRYVLGDSPDMERIYANCGFGPGANIGVHGNDTSFSRKISESWSVSPDAYAYAFEAVKRDFHLVEYLLSDSNGVSLTCFDHASFVKKMRDKVVWCHNNKIAFVAKTAKTDRSIAVEPLLNSYIQKGIDTHMRKLLARVGIDLSDQGLNARMARIGSFPESVNPYVTIDLASASDSISTELVRELLPPDWFSLLNATRSKSYEIDGVIKPFNKFCSMGNGFCFPLETLIFAAICSACGAGNPGFPNFSVYGDDIIVRQSIAEAVLDMLSFCGFEANKSKTFLTGPFRESCGKDWYNGVDVRPFTLDFDLTSLEALFKFWNLSQRSELTKEFFSGTRDIILSLIPNDLRLFRPCEGNDDTGMTVEWDMFMTSPYARWKTSLSTWSWIELISSPKAANAWRRDANKDLILMSALVRGFSSDSTFTVRRETTTSVRRVPHVDDRARRSLAG